MKISLAILALLGLTETKRLNKGVRFLEENSLIDLGDD
jgi:hypothetical protein